MTKNIFKLLGVAVIALVLATGCIWWGMHKQAQYDRVTCWTPWVKMMNAKAVVLVLVPSADGVRPDQFLASPLQIGAASCRF